MSGGDPVPSFVSEVDENQFASALDAAPGTTATRTIAGRKTRP